MRCPKHDHDLVRRRIHEVEVDYCEQSGGMYLDRGELNKVTEPTAGDLEFSTVDLDSFDHPDAEGPIECPRDSGVMMKKVEFVIGTNIILDYCEVCHGFWVEGSELSRINEEVEDFNEVSREISDPPMVQLAQFFWNLPFPK